MDSSASERTGASEATSKTSAVRVGVRVRPFTSKELSASRSSESVLTCIQQGTQEIRLGSRRFTYDAVFDETVSQEDLYQSVAGPLMHNFLEGFNATIMAYGQTGSGKTYTMGSEAHEDTEISSQTGIIPRFTRDLFAKLEKRKGDDANHASSGPILTDFKLTASFLEVYGEDVHDLLVPSRPSVPVREDGKGGVVCSGLTECPISTADDALQVLHEGTMHRTTAATLMNLTSSRSHAVFAVTLTQTTSLPTSDELNTTSTVSRLTFVDLAGSERMKKTGAEGERAREGIKINEGLLALGNVINALADQKKISEGKKVHVPYRQSKLTRLLQDALGGNSQTLFLACVSPADTNASETLSTLYYANRARNIQNAPVQNVDSSLLELHRLRAWSGLLQKELLRHKFGPEDESSSMGTLEDELLIRRDVQEYLEELQTIVAQESGNSCKSKPGDSFNLSKLLSSGQITSRRPLSPTTTTGGDPMDVDGPTNQSLLENFDPELLSEVNPDHEMAILNQLLELQHRDQAFDDKQKEDDAALAKVEGELAEQESMLLQLRDSMKVYHSIKHKYENLIAEVQHLEAEKAELASQLEKATADPSQGCSSAIRRQLDKVEKSLARARIETQKHRDQYRKLEKEQQKCQVLERKIAELKNGKASMIKKQKDAAARHREYTEAKTREIVALKRKERNAEKKVSKLQTEVQIHKRNLEKRQQFIEKLNGKLKQTEYHLMKLLSTRQRNLKDRMSSIQNRSSISHRSSIIVSDITGMHPSSSSEVKSARFVIDRFVTEKVTYFKICEEYNIRVQEYTAAMNDMVAVVEELRQLRDESGPDPQILSETLQAVEDAELKVELISNDVENLRSQMANTEHLTTMQDNLSKMVESQPINTLRTLLIGLLDKQVSSEQQRSQSETTMMKKQKTIESLEDEIDILNRKITAFASQNAKQKELGRKGEGHENIRALQEENSTLSSQLSEKDDEISKCRKRITELEASLMKASVETAAAKQKAAAITVAGEQECHARRAVDVLSKIKEVWDEMGLVPESEVDVVQSIENCLEDTCERQLNEARMRRDSMVASISEAKEKILRMQKSLGLETTPSETFPSLKHEKDFFDDLVRSILPKFEAAVAQSKSIANALKNIQLSLGLADSDLPPYLYRLKQDNLDELSGQKDLRTSFLSSCETELSELRVQKSEILIQNHARQNDIAEVLEQMNVSETATDDFISSSLKNLLGELPEWWTEAAAREVRQVILREPAVAKADKLYSRHLENIHKAVLSEASLHRTLSERLQSVIERAQQILLKTVDGGHDAVEAVASFRDALLRLPKLSKERIDTCLLQIRELIPGVEAMIQSEIEALTVVWEALGTPTTERGKFWESVDEQVETSRPDLSDEIRQAGTNGAGWINRTARQGQRDYMNLDRKLSKLEVVHKEVEALRAQQDAKSKVLSLDSEVRLLNAQLAEFEEKKCSKDRLLSRQTASSHLLREERYRKQMKAKFTSKLEQLNELLKLWNEKNSSDFDPSMLSEDVRMLLQNNSWINERKEFMHLRTTKAKRTGKRRIERVGSNDSDDYEYPAEKRSSKLTESKTTQSEVSKATRSRTHATSTIPAPMPTESKNGGSIKRKAVKTGPSDPNPKKRKTSPAADDAEPRESNGKPSSRVLSPRKGNVRKAALTMLQKSDKRTTLPPFGHVFEETATPRSKSTADKGTAKNVRP